MSNDVHLSPYFERIGFAGSIAPNLATLSALHALHPAAIPFENLNPLLGLPVRLDHASLSQKLLAERRGGYCFEHNFMLMRVLRELEYTVRGHAARVLWGRPEGTVPTATHMVLCVDIGGATYLADVGFGGLTLTAPLKLKTEVEQETPHETFRLLGGDPSYRLEVRIGEDWRPVYEFDLVEQSDEDYAALNETVSGSPRFTQNLIAARAESGRRHSLLNGRLTTYPTGAEPEQRILESVDDLKQVLAGVFGIALPPADLLDPALERVLAAGPAEGQA